MHAYTITITGRPQPKQRPRVVRTRSGAAITYTPDKTRTAERQIAAEWTEAHGRTPLSGHLTIDMTFGMPIPTSWSKTRQAQADGDYHSGRPDIDNLVKTVLDALNGIAYSDDGQVASIRASKYWTTGTGYTEITIRAEENR